MPPTFRRSPITGLDSVTITLTVPQAVLTGVGIGVLVGTVGWFVCAVLASLLDTMSSLGLGNERFGSVLRKTWPALLVFAAVGGLAGAGIASL